MLSLIGLNVMYLENILMLQRRGGDKVTSRFGGSTGQDTYVMINSTDDGTDEAFIESGTCMFP